MQRALVALLVVLTMGPAAAGSIVTDGSTGLHATDTAPSLAANEQSECSFPVETEDNTGQTVTVEEEPEEVVVLAPSAAQHMWEIGAEEKVVGMPVNQFTAYLEGSEERTNVVGEFGQPNQEEVVALEPDLVLAPNVISEEAVTSLRDAGLTVYYSPIANSVNDVYGELDRVGQLVGACEGAEETITEMQNTVTMIEKAVADEEQPRVFYDLGGGWTAGENTLENDLITRAGGANIATAAEESDYFQLSEEVLVAEDPEWIVTHEGRELSEIAGLEESTAMQNDQIVEVNSNFISQHGPRNVIPLEGMAEAFHPEAMAEARATPTPTETPTATPTETPTETEMDPTPTEPEETETLSDDDGAGFAVGVALAAIAALGVIARRRR
jgi:iron complex transport system substrate-binding protein